MLIRVEQKHIDWGKFGSHYRCPVALAVKEQAPNLGFLAVTYDYLIHGDYAQHGARLPANATKFIEDFDNHINVSPFEFELPI